MSTTEVNVMASIVFVIVVITIITEILKRW